MQDLEDRKEESTFINLCCREIDEQKSSIQPKISSPTYKLEVGEVGRSPKPHHQLTRAWDGQILKEML